MLFVLDSSLSDYAFQPVPPAVLTGLDTLAMGFREGKHIIAGPLPTLNALLRIGNLEPKTKAALQLARERFPQLMALPAQYGCYAIVLPHNAGAIRRTNNGGRQIIEIPIGHFSDSSKIQKSVVLGENINDADLAILMAEFYRSQSRVFRSIPIRHESRGGGGGNLVDEYQRLHDDKERFTVTIVDSDKACPASALGNTARTILGVHTENGEPPMMEIVVLDCHEMENALPDAFYEEAFLANNDHRDSVELLRRLSQNGELEVRKFIDVKSGISLGQILSMPANSPAKAFWSNVRLGEVLRHRKEFITIDDLTNYKRPRVQLHVQGIVLRDEVPGALIKTKTQQVCRTGEFLVAEIDAKVGGFGIVPESLDGSIVSSHYFLFVIDEAKLDRRFLDFFIRTPAFREQVAAQGSTNYAAIRPAHVLGYGIPLPPLAEQRRVVARIEKLAAHIYEARTLRHQAVEEAEALLRSILTHDEQAKPTPMRELVKLRSPDVTVRADETYQFAGVYCFGRGVFKSVLKSGMDFAYPRLTRLRAGEFVYPKLMAWEGALGVVPPECDGCVVSTEFPVFEVNEDQVLPEVLDTYFRTPSVWPEIAGESTGTNVRRRRLNPQDFLDYEMPLPSREAQMTLRKVRAELDALKRLQAETAAELAALLPAILDKAFKGEL